MRRTLAVHGHSNGGKKQKPFGCWHSFGLKIVAIHYDSGLSTYSVIMDLGSWVLLDLTKAFAMIVGAGLWIGYQ